MLAPLRYGPAVLGIQKTCVHTNHSIPSSASHAAHPAHLPIPITCCSPCLHAQLWVHVYPAHLGPNQHVFTDHLYVFNYIGTHIKYSSVQMSAQLQHSVKKARTVKCEADTLF